MYLRPLCDIGLEMVPLLKALPESHMARWAGMAQAHPICYMETARDNYGVYVVASLLENIIGWHGEDAKRIRAELKQHLALAKK